VLIDICNETGNNIVAADEPGQLGRQVAAARWERAKNHGLGEAIAPACHGHHIRTLGTRLSRRAT
jgi:hypothetical protein